MTEVLEVFKDFVLFFDLALPELCAGASEFDLFG